MKRTENIIFLFCEKDRKKFHIFVSFRMCPFHGISYFLNFPSNENVKKRYLSTNAFSSVNMKCLYTTTERKDEISMSYCNKNKRFLASV